MFVLDVALGRFSRFRKSASTWCRFHNRACGRGARVRMRPYLSEEMKAQRTWSKAFNCLKSETAARSWVMLPAGMKVKQQPDIIGFMCQQRGIARTCHFVCEPLLDGRSVMDIEMAHLSLRRVWFVCCCHVAPHHFYGAVCSDVWLLSRLCRLNRYFVCINAVYNVFPTFSSMLVWSILTQAACYNTSLLCFCAINSLVHYGVLDANNTDE